MSKTEFTTRVNEICIQVPPTYEEELENSKKAERSPPKRKRI